MSTAPTTSPSRSVSAYGGRRRPESSSQVPAERARPLASAHSERLGEEHAVAGRGVHELEVRVHRARQRGGLDGARNEPRRRQRDRAEAHARVGDDDVLPVGRGERAAGRRNHVHIVGAGGGHRDLERAVRCAVVGGQKQVHAGARVDHVDVGVGHRDAGRGAHDAGDVERRGARERGREQDRDGERNAGRSGSRLQGWGMARWGSEGLVRPAAGPWIQLASAGSPGLARGFRRVARRTTRDSRPWQELLVTALLRDPTPVP